MSLTTINHKSLASDDVDISLSLDDDGPQMISVCFGDHKISMDRQLANISGTIDAKLKTIQCDFADESKTDEEDEVTLDSKLVTPELFAHVVKYMTTCGQYNDFRDVTPKNPTDRKVATGVKFRVYADDGTTEIGSVNTNLETIRTHFAQTKDPYKMTITHDGKDVTEGGSLWITHFKSARGKWGFALFSRGTEAPNKESARVVVECSEFHTFVWNYSNVAKEITDLFVDVDFKTLMLLANLFSYLQITGGLDLIVMRVNHIVRTNCDVELKKMVGDELTDEDEKKYSEIKTIREERLKAADAEEEKKDDK
jgi:hypothetical protein